ncbi:MAG: toxin HipA [Spirochaetes bacterium RIFOXYC1_FULL_54_7]|nr:MAG: toxin HipA [Spirochaetes bacterium RIFOXYC1_FULL_54_7]
MPASLSVRGLQRRRFPVRNDEEVILVFADWAGLDGPQLIGTLSASSQRGKELFSFEYDQAWMESEVCRTLDPDLRWYRGRQFPASDRLLFGTFMDSAPDRWGRLLMRRREAVLARREGRKEQLLKESDYLLGVHDAGRMGGLRFKTSADGPFLTAGEQLAIPPWKRLRELEAAARRFELNAAEPDDSPSDAGSWLELLFAPGSSLGGARPKATILDQDGSLWIAKFPSPRDTIDVGAWEMVLHELATQLGLDVPESRLERFSDYGATFLARRFDRTADQTRVHFASAMTMLGKLDGASYSDGSSYLELVEWLRRTGTRPKADLAELWKRMAFSIAVSNTDDHLRNHGFLFKNAGWGLAPLYDINPDPYGNGLSLNISETDNSLDFMLALQQAPFFMLAREEATLFLARLDEALQDWESLAERHGIPRHEIRQMGRAFRRP